jgi:hypothetical protein
LSQALDRVPSLTALAQLTGDALGAVVLTRTGNAQPLDGFPEHPLLEPSAGVLAVARTLVTSAGARGSFLCPYAGGFLRITAVDIRDESSDHLCAAVLVRPPGYLHGLDAADLELLGAALRGTPSGPGSAGLDPRDAAVRLRRIADLLGVPPGPATLLYAAREGLYVPPALRRRPTR